jgi:hypothetical protein
MEDSMTRQELDAALARLGLDVPQSERDEIAAAAQYIADMAARLRPPGGRDVAAEPAHVVKFPPSQREQGSRLSDGASQMRRS